MNKGKMQKKKDRRMSKHEICVDSEKTATFPIIVQKHI